MMRLHQSSLPCAGRALALGAALFAPVGCRSGGGHGPAGPALEVPQALALVNQNAGTIHGTLRASGNVDGHFTIDGRRKSFHVDGVLFYLQPRNLRFDLKSMGDRKILLGSNSAGFWFCNAEEDTCRCGSHGAEDELADEIPVRPVQIIEALGLGGVPADGTQRTQRVHRQFQQVLFASGESSEGRLEKEYWLDRSEPRLIRRIVFRGDEGSVRMESSLDGYRRLEDDGPWLPYTMTATWPTTGAHLRFRISKWSLASEVGPDGPQFATPPECARDRQAAAGAGY